MLIGKGPHKPEITWDIVHLHSLMINTDLIKYLIAVDTMAPLLRCSFYISKLKARDIITAGEYKTYQTFS